LKAVIDRFEGEYAVLDIEGRIENIKSSEIPGKAREGDVLVKKGDKWIIDREATKNLKKEIDDLADELWED
jgi:hypothetical protein